MPIDTISLLEWSALAAAVLWTLALLGVRMGSYRARRAFRGKGYLRPPTGKAWLRFLYYRHYDSFEDAGIRFYYRMARFCLLLLVILLITLGIFLGSVFLLGKVSSGPSISSD